MYLERAQNTISKNQQTNKTNKQTTGSTVEYSLFTHDQVAYWELWLVVIAVRGHCTTLREYCTICGLPRKRPKLKILSAVSIEFVWLLQHHKVKKS